jgi:hypothetical protein
MGRLAATTLAMVTTTPTKISKASNIAGFLPCDVLLQLLIRIRRAAAPWRMCDRARTYSAIPC